MTSTAHLRILIADHEPRRARAIKVTLAKFWSHRARVATTAREAHKAVDEVLNGQFTCSAAMVAYQLGGPEYLRILDRLRASSNVILVLIDEQAGSPGLTLGLKPLVAPPGVFPEQVELVASLQAIFGPPPHELPEIQNLREFDDALRRQVQTLHPGEDLKEGCRIVAGIVGGLFRRPQRLAQFKLGSIGQGFSGAKVFRIAYREPGDHGTWHRRVLKLTQEKDRDKCLNEVASYRELRKGLAGGVFELIPEIYGAEESTGPDCCPVEAEGWLGIAYKYLHDERYSFFDFAEVYLSPSRCLRKVQRTHPTYAPSDLPARFIESLTTQLQIWYGRGAHLGTPQPLWSAGEPPAPSRGVAQFPPYCFTQREKWRIIEALHNLEPYGRSLIRKMWGRCMEQALRCLPTGDREGRRICASLGATLVLRTHVHGDLNAHNTFMALGCDVPFLIDFACYQSNGHAVHDFARLEVAIKFDLMSREENGAPDGLDLNSQPFGSWCDAEDWLSTWPALTAPLPPRVESEESVARAYRLCRYLRQRAGEVHTAICPASARSSIDFRRSYEVSLLFETLRAIRYDTLPHLKRILAVYSVSLIVEHLDV
jgi:hypothetical protein